MGIDKLTPAFDSTKFKKDCVLHRIMMPYIEKQSASFCDGKISGELRKELEKNSAALELSLKHARCFPSTCEKCMGLEKCIDCIISDNCIDAFIQLSSILQLTGD